MAAAVDLPTTEGPMKVRLGDGAIESSPLAPSTSTTAPAPQELLPKHDGEEVDPVAADMEKKAADLRDVLGQEPEGNIVDGIEDDVLWTLMRRFDTVSSPYNTTTSLTRSKSTTSYTQPPTCHRASRTCA